MLHNIKAHVNAGAEAGKRNLLKKAEQMAFICVITFVFSLNVQPLVYTRQQIEILRATEHFVLFL